MDRLVDRPLSHLVTSPFCQPFLDPAGACSPKGPGAGSGSEVAPKIRTLPREGEQVGWALASIVWVAGDSDPLSPVQQGEDPGPFRGVREQAASKP